MGNFDIITLIFLALAVFIVIKLRSVLGTKHGEEPNTFAPSPRPEAPSPGPMPAPAAPPQAVNGFRWAGFAAEGSALAQKLDRVAAHDAGFNAQGFVNGARGAYEMIVTAFAQGDRSTLKTLLAADVYEGFESAIREREARGESVDQRFVGIDRAEIVDADVEGRMVHVTVRFNAQMFSATRNKAGDVVAGDPARVTVMNDVWTFARDGQSADPNWKLVATSSAG